MAIRVKLDSPGQNPTRGGVEARLIHAAIGRRGRVSYGVTPGGSYLGVLLDAGQTEIPPKCYTSSLLGSSREPLGRGVSGRRALPVD